MYTLAITIHSFVTNLGEKKQTKSSIPQQLLLNQTSRMPASEFKTQSFRYELLSMYVYKKFKTYSLIKKKKHLRKNYEEKIQQVQCRYA